MDNNTSLIIEILHLEGIVPILGTLLGTIGGGFFTYFITRFQHNHSRRLALDNISITKLEIIYSTILDIEIKYRAVWGRASHLRIPAAHVNSFLKENDVTKKSKNESTRIPFEELEMLIALYVPEKLQDTKDFIKNAQSFSGKAVLSEIGYEDKTDQVRDAEWRNLDQQYQAFSDSMNTLKTAITTEMNSFLN